MKLLKFYFSYFSLASRYKEIVAPFLTERGSISISLLRRKIVIKNFNHKLHNKIGSLIALFNEINKEYFTVDEYKINAYRIELVSKKIPDIFKLPKKYIFQDHLIPIGVNAAKEIVEINLKLTSSTLIAIPSGAGKSFFVRNVVKEISANSKIEIYIINGKADEEYDDIKNAVIVKTQEDALALLLEIQAKIVLDKTKSRLIIFEEYAQFSDPSKYRSDKRKKEIAQQIGSILETASQLFRTLGVHLICVSQNLNREANPIDITNFSNRIYGHVTKTQAQVNNIDPVFESREDLKMGKFIYSLNFGKFNVFRGLYARK